MPPIDDVVVADAHHDLLMLVSRRPRHRWADYFRQRWIPQLRAGRVALQVLPVYIDTEFLPEGALRETLRMIEAAHQIAEANADEVTLCRTGAQIAEAGAAGRIALVLALEGCPQIGTDLALFQTMQRLGVRMISFTHFGRSMLADGSAEDGTGGGLTRAGIEAVQLLEELGILIDVSHVGRRGVEDILGLARHPVIASHSAAYALRQHHRNLTDDQLRGIAATGGMVCVNLFGGFLAENQPSMQHLVEHIGHIATVIGADKVGLAGDFVAEIFAEKIPACDRPLVVEGVNTEAMIPGLAGPAGFPLVLEALSETMPAATVQDIASGNLFGFLRSL